MLGEKDISVNFSVAKVISILLVATGHYFSTNSSIPFWAPVSCGLFVFGFSSGYFTSKNYRFNFSYRIFWKKKFDRLFYRLLMINLFLLFLFLVQGKAHIWHWQTLLSITGLSGFLDWFNISIITPFGNGLWFFTVLLLFYLIFPLLNRLIYSKNHAVFFLSLFFLFSIVLNHHLYMGHALWLTLLSFYCGVFSDMHGYLITFKNIAVFMIFSVVVFMILKLLLGFNDFNYFIVQIFSFAIVLFLFKYRLNKFTFTVFTSISGAILEIYFIHTYLFVHIENMPTVVPFILSLVLIISVSMILSWSAKYLLLIPKPVVLHATRRK